MSNRRRDAAAVERAYSILTVKAVKEDERVIEGIASTPTPDRMGDIVEPMGAKFSVPMPLLWQHDHSKPVGHVEFAKPNKNGIPFRARILAPEDGDPQVLKDRLDEAWGSVKRGLVRAVSIGFKSLEFSVMEDGGWRFLQWEWLELSLVTIPANAEATINTVKSIDRDLRAASGVRSGRKSARDGASSNSKTRKSQVSKISEQISALEAKEETLKKGLEKFDIDDMSEDDENRFDELSDELDDVQKKLKRLRRQESIALAERAEPVRDVKSGGDAAAHRGGYRRNSVDGPNKNIPKGIPFVRSIVCLANAQGNNELAAMLAEKHYADDPRIARFLRLTPEMKGAVPAAYVGDGGGWAEDIAEAQTIGSEFIDFLRPMTIVDRLSGFRRVPFNVKVPRQTTGQGGYWVGEAKPTPLTSGVFDTVTLGLTKVGAISVMSREQMRFSNINAETTIRDDLAKAVVGKLDSTFVGTASAVGGVSPAGLLQGVSAQSSAGDTADDVREDLATLYKLLSAAEIDLEGTAFVTTGRLKKAISLMRSSLGVAEFPGADTTLDGQPFIGSNHVGGGDLIAISTRDILLADDGEVSVEMSGQASLEMLDASLQQDPTAGTGASVVSLWQNGLVAIKCERMINWVKARAAAVQFVGDATYLGVATA